MSRTSPSQTEFLPAKRKRTARSESVQALVKSKTPEKVFLVLHETEGEDRPLYHEVLGVYSSLQDANAAAYDFWEEIYSYYDETYEEAEQGDQAPDGENFLYKGRKDDGAMHNLYIDDEGERSEVRVKPMPLQ
ncbi:hypothetical protein MMC34_006309 [Xylographa carneopallida]|nr:hypothetical protein [Xylographa carneopallida]